MAAVTARLLADVDTGIDDACALLHLVGAHRLGVGPELAAVLADPETPVWVLTDARGLVRSVVPRERILAAVHATRRP